MNKDEQIAKLEKRIASMREDYKDRRYFGRLPDLLCDIVQAEVSLDELKGE